MPAVSARLVCMPNTRGRLKAAGFDGRKPGCICPVAPWINERSRSTVPTATLRDARLTIRQAFVEKDPVSPQRSDPCVFMPFRCGATQLDQNHTPPASCFPDMIAWEKRKPVGSVLIFSPAQESGRDSRPGRPFLARVLLCFGIDSGTAILPTCAIDKVWIWRGRLSGAPSLSQTAVAESIPPSEESVYETPIQMTGEAIAPRRPACRRRSGANG